MYACTLLLIALCLPCRAPQPLFIQTPLQVMLETLVEKLQLQADAITGMQGKVSRVRWRLAGCCCSTSAAVQNIEDKGLCCSRQQ